MSVEGITVSLDMTRADGHYVLVDIDELRADFAGLTLTPEEAGELGGALCGYALKAGIALAGRKIEEENTGGD